MGFPPRGMTPKEVTEQLESLRAEDADWRSGRTWSLVYSTGDDHEQVLKDAYGRYFNENALGPRAFPSLARMESDVVSALLDLLNGDPGSAGGTMASGGTESIILALKAYRDSTRLQSHSVVMPSTAHPAFRKACHLLKMDAIVVPVGTDLVADVASMSDAIREDTVALIASAPAYPYGLVDPIDQLGELAEDRGIGLHVDAAIGGFVLAFARRLGHDIPPFDFAVDGVTSISADLHKYGYGPKGASTILYRHRALRRFQFYVDTGWPGGLLASPTLLGTRPGGVIAAAWAAIHHLGLSGYDAIFSEVLSSTKRLREGIEAIGDLKVIGEPPVSVFAFTSEIKDVFAIADRMEEKGWRMDRQVDPNCIHMIVNPTHTGVTDEFVAQLSVAYEEAPGPRDSIHKYAYGVTDRFETSYDLTDSIVAALEEIYDRPPMGSH